LALADRRAITTTAHAIRDIATDHDIIADGELRLDPETVDSTEITDEHIMDAVETARTRGLNEFDSERASNATFEDRVFFVLGWKSIVFSQSVSKGWVLNSQRLPATGPFLTGANDCLYRSKITDNGNISLNNNDRQQPTMIGNQREIATNEATSIPTLHRRTSRRICISSTAADTRLRVGGISAIRSASTDVGREGAHEQ
jgi:hypothetical protein